MYTKTKTWGLAIALVFLFGALAIIAPKNIYADASDTESSTATVEFEPGVISIDSVATLDFGKQAISATSENYAAEEIDSAIRISDLRGSGEGWDLNVKLSAFTNNGKELSGAYITIDDATVVNVNNSSSTAPDFASNSVIIPSDNQSVSIFTADDDTDAGMGTWELSLNPSDVELTVLPGTAYALNYQADLTWTLQATP